jgi:hypothetical protein
LVLGLERVLHAADEVVVLVFHRAVGHGGAPSVVDRFGGSLPVALVP